MAKYSLIRGWLECEFEDVSRIEMLVSEHWTSASKYQVDDDAAGLYKGGWAFPKSPINWTSLVFFGANIGERAVPFVSDCLQYIARSIPDVEGLFFVDDEEHGDPRLWVLKDGKLTDIQRLKEMTARIWTSA